MPTKEMPPQGLAGQPLHAPTIEVLGLSKGHGVVGDGEGDQKDRSGLNALVGEHARHDNIREGDARLSVVGVEGASLARVKLEPDPTRQGHVTCPGAFEVILQEFGLNGVSLDEATSVANRG